MKIFDFVNKWRLCLESTNEIFQNKIIKIKIQDDAQFAVDIDALEIDHENGHPVILIRPYDNPHFENLKDPQGPQDPSKRKTVSQFSLEWTKALQHISYSEISKNDQDSVEIKLIAWTRNYPKRSYIEIENLKLTCRPRNPFDPSLDKLEESFVCIYPEGIV